MEEIYGENLNKLEKALSKYEFTPKQKEFLLCVLELGYTLAHCENIKNNSPIEKQAYAREYERIKKLLEK